MPLLLSEPVEVKPLHFIGELIEVQFDQPPTLEKKPGCPDEFVWHGETYRVVEKLSEWHDGWSHPPQGSHGGQYAPRTCCYSFASWLVGCWTGLLPRAHGYRSNL
jgi:hypothetical protein